MSISCIFDHLCYEGGTRRFYTDLEVVALQPLESVQLYIMSCMPVPAEDKNEIVQRFEKAITPKTKLIVVSQIAWIAFLN